MVDLKLIIRFAANSDRDLLDRNTDDSPVDHLVRSVQSADASFLERKALLDRNSKTTTSKTSSSNSKKCASMKSSRSLEKRALDELTSASGGEWALVENDYCLASKVKSGNKVTVADVSGCSGVFFFKADGVPSAVHITAGQEAAGGVEAAEKVKADGSTPASVQIWAQSGTTKGQLIKTAIAKVFPGIDSKITVHPYTLDTKKSNMRWEFSATVPSTTVSPKEYDCTQD